MSVAGPALSLQPWPPTCILGGGEAAAGQQARPQGSLSAHCGPAQGIHGSGPMITMFFAPVYSLKYLNIHL